MKLPSILAAVAAVVVAHWLHRRVERVEQVSGAWRVQSPDPLVRGQEAPAWDAPNWWASDQFDRALSTWHRDLTDGSYWKLPAGHFHRPVIETSPGLTNEECKQLHDLWSQGEGRSA